MTVLHNSKKFPVPTDPKMETQHKWTFVAIGVVSFVVGFFAGYEAKALRIRYLEWKRERLAKKLRLTEAQIKNASTSSMSAKDELAMRRLLQIS